MRRISIVATGALLLAMMPVVAQAQHKLGVVGPITGPSAAFGAQLKNGVEQAIEDINAAGGVLGQKLIVQLGDDVGDPKQGVSVANKFAGDGVKWVIGHFNSGVTIPASEIYAEHNILMITPSATNPRVTERGLWNVFRTCGRDDQQGLVAGEHIAKAFAGKTIAIIHDKTTYGQGLADETRKVLIAKGFRNHLYEGVNAGEKDFSALIGKLKAAKVDLLYWGGLHTELGLIIRQARDANLPLQAMGADGIVSDEFAAIGGPGVEGTLMTFPPDPRKRPESAAVVKRFEARGINPEAYTLYAYAALQVMKQAAERARSLESRKVAAAIHSGMEFDTVLGRMSFNKKGDRTNLDYTVYTWKKGADGRITYIENR